MTDAPTALRGEKPNIQLVREDVQCRDCEHSFIVPAMLVDGLRLDTGERYEFYHGEDGSHKAERISY